MVLDKKSEPSYGPRLDYDPIKVRYLTAWSAILHGQHSSRCSDWQYCASLGHKQDDESGLVYMRARFYEPGSGRFTSEDPSRNGSNWFVYCSNNSTSKVDRTGKDDEFDWDELAAELDAVGRTPMSTGIVSLGGCTLTMSRASMLYFCSGNDDIIMLGAALIMKVTAIQTALVAGAFAVGAAKRVAAGEYLTIASQYISALGEDGLEYAAAYVTAAQGELGLQNYLFGI